MNAIDIRRVNRLLSDIRDQLARARTHGDTDRPQSQPKPAPIVTVNTLLEIPVAIREYYESQNKPKWGKRLKTLLETAAVGAALWLGILNLRVLHEIQKQTPEIARSAKAAETAANTELFQMKGLQAAFLHFTLNPFQLRAAGPFVLRLVVENTGRVIARDVKGHVTVRIKSLPDERQIGREIDFPLPPDSLDPSLPEEAGHQIVKDYTAREFDAAMWNEVSSLKRAIEAEAHFSYDDGFGSTVPKSICRIFMARGFTSRDPVKKIGPTVQMGFPECGEFNGALARAIEEKNIVDREAEKQIQEESAQKSIK